MGCAFVNFVSLIFLVASPFFLGFSSVQLSLSNGAFVHIFQFLTYFNIIYSNLFILQLGRLRPREGSIARPRLWAPAWSSFCHFLPPLSRPWQPHLIPFLLCLSFAELWAVLLQGRRVLTIPSAGSPLLALQHPQSCLLLSLPAPQTGLGFGPEAVERPIGYKREHGRGKLTEVPGQSNNNVPHSSSSPRCASPITLHIRCRPAA